MGATTRDSVLYTKLHANKFIGEARDVGGRAVPIPFQHTVVSGETGGATPGARDKVRLCVLPANCMVVGLELVADNVWPTATTNGTLQLGDSGDDDRYMLATELYTATGGPIATERTSNSLLAFTGQNYKPTADTVVLAEYRTANPTVGKIFKGVFWVIPGA